MPDRFPSVSGESLSRKPHTVPDDLEGSLHLVFVAFRQVHQRDVDAWLVRLADLEPETPGLSIYEVPLLKRYPGFYRRWIDGGMRAGIPDPHTRDRTITVYTDRAAFLRAAGLDDESEIWSVLMDHRGQIFWSHIGPADDPAEQALRSAILSRP